MRNPKGMRGLLFMAAAMASMEENVLFVSESFKRIKETRKRKIIISDVRLTPAQLKRRNKEKRAKLARKINR
jgi:hypothetical protein